ncbi:hypothetical protein LTR86_008048 [Recurvomyces mirabilis]|nr:hypothetical protein LTR86_008048 [Recurvomyces mirabilis]
MRLLNTSTLEFREFVDPPPYVILSHRWGDDEVSYEEFVLTRRPFEQLPPYLADEVTEIRRRKGYKKILDFAARADNPLPSEDDYWLYRKLRWKNSFRFDWCWIDTCCIDKKSSAELSEAINSMWQWYSNASLCIVYLVDITICSKDETYEHYLKASEWFTRCWTLQELLAPRTLLFYTDSWTAFLVAHGTYVRWIRTGHDAHRALEDVAGIPSECIDYGTTTTYSIAQKMSWAANRRATRIEDVAYSLLGLLNINMPLLYGEGARAFTRLQTELLRSEYDDSIFAWHFVDQPRLATLCEDHQCHSQSLLASSPDMFQGCGAVRRGQSAEHEFYVSNSVVHMELRAPTQRLVRTSYRSLYDSSKTSLYFIELACRDLRPSEGPGAEIDVPCRIVVLADEREPPMDADKGKDEFAGRGRDTLPLE